MDKTIIKNIFAGKGTEEIVYIMGGVVSWIQQLELV